MIGWWDDWQRYRVLPYGSDSLSTEPAIVYDVISLCGDAAATAFAERDDGG